MVHSYTTVNVLMLSFLKRYLDLNSIQFNLIMMQRERTNHFTGKIYNEGFFGRGHAMLLTTTYHLKNSNNPRTKNLNWSFGEHDRRCRRLSTLQTKSQPAKQRLPNKKNEYTASISPSRILEHLETFPAEHLYFVF